MRSVLIRYDSSEDCWLAECPSLPGCVSDGATRDEAIANIQEAISGWIEVAEAAGIEIPVDNGEMELLQVGG